MLKIWPSRNHGIFYFYVGMKLPIHQTSCQILYKNKKGLIWAVHIISPKMLFVEMTRQALIQSALL